MPDSILRGLLQTAPNAGATFQNYGAVTPQGNDLIIPDAPSGLSRLRVPSEIAERVIAHVPGGVRRVYDRFEYRLEKRQALEQ